MYLGFSVLRSVWTNQLLGVCVENAWNALQVYAVLQSMQQ